MSLDGVWKIEILGVYGWEAWATAFLDSGRYWAASATHYTTGSYEQRDDVVVLSGHTAVYDPHQAMFGKQGSDYRIDFEGRHTDDRIDGHAKETDGSVLMRFRASKVADLA